MTDLLFQPGVYLRCPGGNVENVAEQKAAGITWALMNIGGDPCVQSPSAWDINRTRYRLHGIAQGPWKHCHSLEDIDALITKALVWNAGAPADVLGLNIEDVVGAGLNLSTVAMLVKARWTLPTGKPVHMATLAWVQNAQGWHHLADYYVALELFPKEQPLFVTEWKACIDHAFAEGLERVTLLYSTTSPRSTYPNVAHCLYTADDVRDWNEWTDTVPQVIPKPPPPPPPPEEPMLTATQFPYTGPLAPGVQNRATVKGLKRAMIRMHYLDQPLGSETDDWGAALTAAFKEWWKDAGGIGNWSQYGRGSWLLMREARVTSGPNKGKYAMDAKALAYVRQDALTLCYPHQAGVSGVYVGQGLHETAGLTGNWAIDFMAPGGTKVLAVEAAKITRLSGRDPSLGANQTIGIFGWSIHYETALGLRYFSTHYGTRSVIEGQRVDCGEVIGTCGAWPGDPGRSHTHLGVTHPLGSVAAKKRITEVSLARKVTV